MSDSESLISDEDDRVSPAKPIPSAAVKDDHSLFLMPPRIQEKANYGICPMHLHSTPTDGSKLMISVL